VPDGDTLHSSLVRTELLCPAAAADFFQSRALRHQEPEFPGFGVVNCPARVLWLPALAPLRGKSPPQRMPPPGPASGRFSARDFPASNPMRRHPSGTGTRLSRCAVQRIGENTQVTNPTLNPRTLGA